ncbi:MAG: hypothetical protein KBB01_04685 [Candidatus Omnitrophica bacterium]|jgi:hypothetical protein|nr:hypothetical protein [Candidatus Omnitrophota bacterium]
MKYLVNILAIAILFIIILGIVNFKKSDNFESLKDNANGPVNFVKDGLKALKYNIFFDFSQKKKKSISMAREEAELMSLAPHLFGEFSRQDWDKFWEVIYQPIKEKKGNFSFKRYRTKEEMRERFLKLYESAFFGFGSDDWKYFWKITLGENE